MRTQQPHLSVNKDGRGLEICGTVWPLVLPRRNYAGWLAGCLADVARRSSREIAHVRLCSRIQ